MLNKIAYKGWANCFQLTNQKIELVVTTDVGPRVMFFGFVGGTNQFKEYTEQSGQVGGDEWRIYGGHRLWHAPEHKQRTYSPDNGSVELQDHGNFVRLVQAKEANTGIQKQIDIYLSADAASVRLVHRLTNHNLWDIVTAPWTPTVTPHDAVAIAPLPPRGSHDKELLPTSTMALWAYTDFRDPRWYWGSRYVILRQDKSVPSDQKIGMSVPQGWVAGVAQGNLFVKRFDVEQGATYPDLGSNVELFTNPDMLELETLAPFKTLAAGESVEHEERWYLFKGVKAPQNDQDVDREILPLVNMTK